MRKIFKTVLILSVAAGLFSCTMDLRQPGAIDAENALTSIQDAQNLRRGLYVNFRSAVAGGFVSYAEVQSDLFQPSSGFGNNYGSFFRWDFTASEGGSESVWASCYSIIASANFFMENINNVLDNPTDAFSQADLDELKIYLGETYFFRAYYHFELAYRFCQVYDEATAANTYGVPYIETYNPTSDRNSYPSRGTLAETYEKINADLDLAEEYITTPGSVGSMWLTADAVAAFRSRVYLAMKNYDQVIAYAAPLVSSNRYPLVNNASDFSNMWVNDSGRECIMMLDATNESNGTPSSYDVMYINQNAATGNYEPGFIPTSGVIGIFQQYPDDLRYAQFFEQRTATEPTGSATVFLFEKFPGNPALFPQGTAVSNYLQKPKPFRIAEVYLNLAEAYAQTNNPEANNILTSLRAARIPSYTSAGSGDVMSEIKSERVRELIGEGFRLWDLKRWGDPVVRSAAQAPSIMYTHSSMDQTFLANDIRFVWPIPQAECDSNPNISGEQNPGY